jgi:hypothetical protein
MLADVNGDGRDDFVMFLEEGTFVSLSRPRDCDEFECDPIFRSVNSKP